ncbi:NAD kinase [Nocardioides zeae]|uniref:NAD kinase n=1 Tax=Nocardioides imazamoxiresistens TaxID=3231893 RepID=A0ABU3PSQ9_9ACTN|nr:NAD kinase [Nocardioides zeae]MDT9592226.1 NAD kinase [Nocardioides zeae]
MSTTRRALVLTHTGRADARSVAEEMCRALGAGGIEVLVPADEAPDLDLTSPAGGPAVRVVEDPELPDLDVELAVVIGGDGTILRAAERTRRAGTPLLGVNLGHVGFLAEAEHDAVAATIEAVLERRYTIEERLALDVTVFHDNQLLAHTFALNEASVEKAARERMIEVVLEVDGRPISRWGCDGVVLATPTGSTAYNFSAGGPVVWPEVEALLMVPISAHALFARPMVVAPTSVIAVELLTPGTGAGVLWCDGRRTVELPTGARIEVTRSAQPVRLVRLHASPFANRLVAKFGLSVEGWRGAAERRRQDAGSGEVRDRAR